MNDLKLFLPKIAAFALLLLSVLVMAMLGGYSQDEIHYQLPSIINQSYSCTTGNTTSEEKLRIYVNTASIAQSLADRLCGDSVVKRQYHQVQAHWGGGEMATASFIGKGIGDVVNAKDNIVQAFDAQSTYRYRRLASYAPYQAYLISLTEKPVVSKDYLMGLRIGLLDYPTSRSGHIIPMNLIKNLGLREDQMSIVYSDNHTGLRELLASGAVDVISSYWSESDAERFSANYIQPISENGISGSSWYLKMESRNTDLFCALQTSLAGLAAQQEATYFGDLDFSEGCELQVVEN